MSVYVCMYLSTIVNSFIRRCILVRTFSIVILCSIVLVDCFRRFHTLMFVQVLFPICSVKDLSGLKSTSTLGSSDGSSNMLCMYVLGLPTNEATNISSIRTHVFVFTVCMYPCMNVWKPGLSGHFAAMFAIFLRVKDRSYSPGGKYFNPSAIASPAKVTRAFISSYINA